MKRIITLVSALFIGFVGYSQTYISEDFSTFTDSLQPPVGSGWKNADSVNVAPNDTAKWRFDNPGGRALNTPISDPAAILDSDFFGPAGTQDAYLSSPSFDASLATTVLLEFDHYFQAIGGSFGEIQVFDGISWVSDTVFSATTGNPTHEIIDISALVAGVPNAQVRFKYVGSYGWYWIIDNITIFQPAADDAKVVSVDSTVAGCGLDTNETIVATVTNVGSTPITNFPINYTINGGAITAETVMATLNPGDTIQYSFMTGANLSATGSYTIDVFTSLRGDANNVNDTATGISVNKQVINTFPYTEDFESGNGDWIPGGTNSSWALGTPSGAVINSAANGLNSYITSLAGTYNANEESFVLGPCFDFTSLSAPQIKMNVWWNSENSWDGAVLQMSIDDGLSWQKVGDFGDPNNWYTDNTINGLQNAGFTGEGWSGTTANIGSNGWVLAEHDLTGAANEPSVQLRIAFGSDGSVLEEGFAFDDILIQDAPAADAGIVEIVRPNNGCALGTTDSIEVRIINAGSASISNFPLSFNVNGGAIQNDTFPGTIPPGDTVNFVFTPTGNFSIVGDYTVQVYTSVNMDGNNLNDTLFKTITNIPVISSLPYAEGFETGNGGWITTGTNSSWQIGFPASANINSTGTGFNSYVTNLTGNYNTNEVSYIESPCFDLSSLAADPIITFQNTFNFGFNGESWLEQSIDGGLTWTKVIDNGTAREWYNNTTLQQWDNTSSAGAGIWVLSENILVGVAGQSSVRLRFVMDGDAFSTGEGIGIDSIRIDLPPAIDGGIIAITAPGTNCSFGVSDTVTVLVKNFGLDTLTSTPVSYELNGNPPVTETITTTILPGDTLEYTFTTASVDLSIPGTYSFLAYTGLAADPKSNNDSTSVDVENSLRIAPYTENFDSFTSGTGFDNAGSMLANGWTATPASAPDFFWGARNAATGSGGTGPNVDHTGNGGNFIYVEGSNGGNGSTAELISPCIDITATTAPKLEFWYHKVGGNMGDLFVDVLDNGVWTNVDVIAGATQAAITDPYLMRTVNLIAYAGSSIQVRFRSGPKTGFATDMAIDDFRVYEPTPADAAIIDITSPSSGCGLTATDTVRATITNAGTSPLDTIPMVYTVNGMVILDTNFVTLNPGDTLEFTFSTSIDLSVPGTYDITAYTDVNADGDNNNDTTFKSVASIPVIASFPYLEDFENGNGGWVPGGINSSWAVGTPANGIINSPANGLNSYVTNLTGTYNPDEESFVQGPCFDFSAMVRPQIKMNVWWNSEFSWDGAVLQSSIDGGASWQKVGALGDPTNWYTDNSINGLQVNLEPSGEGWTGRNSTSNGSGGWVLAEHDLTGLAGESGVILRVAFGSDGSVQDEGFAFDDVLVLDAPAFDAGILEIVRPISDCSLGMNDSVEVVIVNSGIDTIANFPLSFTVNNGAAQTDTFPGMILPGDTVNFVFNPLTINLSTAGDYNIRAYTSLMADGNNLNDSAEKTVTSVPTITSLPYTQGFESGTGGWLTNGTNSSWQVGTPAGPTITTAGGGISSYVTNLTGNYNINEVSYLESPCFDLTTVGSDPILRFRNTFVFGFNGEAWLEQSIDGGLTWTKVLDNGGALNWYNNTVDQDWDNTSSGGAGVWVLSENVLTGLAGQSQVKLRFVMDGDPFSTGEGIGIDDILLDLPSPIDAGIIALTAPGTNCGFGVSDTVRIQVKNFGSDTLTSTPVSYELNNGAAVTEVITSTILPGDTLEYTFTANAVNLSTPGTYSFKLYSGAAMDGNPTNDTIVRVVENTLKLAPYTEDFDSFTSGTGFDNIGSILREGWVATPDVPNFAWGARNNATGSTGTGPDFDHTTATSGVGNFIFVEGSNGANGDSALLTSPCIDLSNLVNPRLSFWYHKFGANMGDLYVDIYDGTVWINGVDTIIGQVQTATTDTFSLRDTTSLGAYIGSTIQVRFRSSPKTGFGTDMAIDDFRVYEGPVSVEDIETASLNFSIFPNPTVGQFTLVMPSSKNSINVEILDTKGQLVYNNILTPNSQRRTSIDMSNNAKGIYFVKISDSNSTRVEKLIVR